MNSALTPIHPCHHMRYLVHRYADGSLRGIKRWYTKMHIWHCKQCRDAVLALQGLIERVRDLQKPQLELSEDVWSRIHERWSEQDTEQHNGP